MIETQDVATQKQGLLRSATPAPLPAVEEILNAMSLHDLRVWLDDETSTERFLERFGHWSASFGFSALRLHGYQPRLTLGVTQALTDFYLRHASRRMRILRGEYPFTRDMMTALNRPLLWLEDEPLAAGDALVLSLPFSGDGGLHVLTSSLLQEADRLGVPVLLDCAFAGLSNLCLPKELPFAVESVAFSFSKLWAFGHGRLGVEYARPRVAGSASLLAEWDYGPKLAAFLAFRIMEQIPFELPRSWFRPRQIELCRELGLCPSDCYLFGLSEKTEWDEFLRDKTYRRVCLSARL